MLIACVDREGRRGGVDRKVNTDNPPVYLLLFEVAGSWLVGVLIG